MIDESINAPSFPIEISGYFQSQGLVLLGVTPPVPFEKEEQGYQNWLDKGNHGTMTWLETHSPLKYHPELILPGTKSLLFVGLNYFQEKPSDHKGGLVARYAWGRDYHKVLGNKLRRITKILREKYPGEEFRSFTDATPLDERSYAVSAGLGFITKNTLLAADGLGTWLLLGEILTTKEFIPSKPITKTKTCPTQCQRCIKECPTGALHSPYQIDARRCISYLTIEYKGLIPLDLRPLMKDWVFGCDLCQNLCPLNIRSKPTTEPDFLNWKAGNTLDIMEILTMTDDQEFKNRFAGSPLIRAGLRMMRRNCCIAAGNSGNWKYREILEKLSMDEDLLIAHHALWAYNRLNEIQEELR